MEKGSACMQWKENTVGRVQEGGMVQVGGWEQDQAPDI